MLLVRRSRARRWPLSGSRYGMRLPERIYGNGENCMNEQEYRRREAQRRKKEKKRKKQRQRLVILAVLLFMMTVFMVAVLAAAKVRSAAGRNPREAAAGAAIKLAELPRETVALPDEPQELPEIGALYGIYVYEKGWSHFFADNSYGMAPVGAYITGIRVTLHNQPSELSGTVAYQVNLSGSGWLDWQTDVAEAGGIEGAMPLEAIAMRLTGELAEYYDIFYSVLQNNQWTDWVKNGQEAGASGVGLRVDGIRVSVVKRQAEKESYAGGIDPNRPMVALTYDDGPSGSATPRILAKLEENGAHATFFMVGQKAEKNPGLIKRMVDQGCEVANHTYDHTLMNKVDPAELASQLARTNQVVADASGVTPVLMRPCGGVRNDVGMNVVGAISMPAVMWSIDTLDWKSRDADSTIRTVLDQVKDGDIILMHDLYDATAEASETIIPELIKRGFQLVTVSELSSYRGGMLPGKSYSQFRP